jgi:uncharacterized membrane protein YebE (DUF533 family)
MNKELQSVLLMVGLAGLGYVIYSGWRNNQKQQLQHTPSGNVTPQPTGSNPGNRSDWYSPQNIQGYLNTGSQLWDSIFGSVPNAGDGYSQP